MILTRFYISKKLKMNLYKKSHDNKKKKGVKKKKIWK